MHMRVQPCAELQPNGHLFFLSLPSYRNSWTKGPLLGEWMIETNVVDDLIEKCMKRRERIEVASSSSRDFLFFLCLFGSFLLLLRPLWTLTLSAHVVLLFFFVKRRRRQRRVEGNCVMHWSSIRRDEMRKLSKAFLCFRFCHHHRHEEENMMLTDVQLARRNDLRPIDWSKVLATSQHQRDEATNIDVVDVIDRRSKYALFQLAGSACVVFSANIYYPSS